MQVCVLLENSSSDSDTERGGRGVEISQTRQTDKKACKNNTLRTRACPHRQAIRSAKERNTIM